MHNVIIDNERIYNEDLVRQSTVLAFDFGERRVGIAIGEHLIATANPLCTIDNESNEKRFEAITALVEAWQPKLFVVGYPLNSDGTEHAMSQLCKKFARRLNGRFNIPIILIDERYSSIAASQSLNAQGVKGRAQKILLDTVAAQTILQSYFDHLP